MNQDPLGYGGRRIGYSDCRNVSYMLLTKQFVSNKARLFAITLFQNACQIWSKDLKDGSKAIGLYNSVSINYRNSPFFCH